MLEKIKIPLEKRKNIQKITILTDSYYTPIKYKDELTIVNGKLTYKKSDHESSEVLIYYEIKLSSGDWDKITDYIKGEPQYSETIGFVFVDYFPGFPIMHVNVFYDDVISMNQGVNIFDNKLAILLKQLIFNKGYLLPLPLYLN